MKINQSGELNFIRYIDTLHVDQLTSPSPHIHSYLVPFPITIAIHLMRSYHVESFQMPYISKVYPGITPQHEGTPLTRDAHSDS